MYVVNVMLCPISSKYIPDESTSKNPYAPLFSTPVSTRTK